MIEEGKDGDEDGVVNFFGGETDKDSRDKSFVFVLLADCDCWPMASSCLSVSSRERVMPKPSKSSSKLLSKMSNSCGGAGCLWELRLRDVEKFGLFGAFGESIVDAAVLDISLTTGLVCW